MADENRTLLERARALKERADQSLKRSPLTNLLVAAVMTVVAGKLAEARWSTIVIVAIAGAVIAFLIFYLRKTPWLPRDRRAKLAEAYRRALSMVRKLALLISALASVVTIVQAATDDDPPPRRSPPPSVPTTSPEPTQDTVTEDSTNEPEPSPTVRRAHPTSQALQEIALSRPDIRGLFFDLDQTNAVRVKAAAPWDFANVRLCSAARFQASPPGWTDTIMFANYYDESASSASASFYSEEEAEAWLDRVLDEIDRCTIEVGPTRPRIAGEDETWRFRTHVDTFDGRLHVDRIVVRVENVVLQVIVGRYDGDNQTVAENVAARPIARLVELMRD